MFNTLFQYFRAENSKVVSFAFILLGLSVFFYVWYFGVNILYQDEWSFVHLVKKYKANELSFSDLYAPNNEHRIFFPRLFYIIMLPFSNMNSKFFMFVDASFLVIGCLCIFSIAKKQFHFSNSKIPIWFIIIPLFIFNLRQSRNLLWGFQITFYLVLVASIVSFYFLKKSSAKNKINKLQFVLAIVFAVIATFSSGMGFLVWAGGLMQLVLKSFSFKSKSHYFLGGIWLIVGTLFFFIYTIGLESLISEKIISGLKNPIEFLHFFFALISLTSVHSLSKFAFIIGIILFLLSIYIFYSAYKNKRLTENSFWVSLYVFSILFAILTSLGRFGMSFDYADRSRYTIFTNLYLIATFAVAYDLFKNSNFNKKIFKLLFAGLIFLALELNGIGLVYGNMFKAEREKTKEIILNYKTVSVSKEIKAIIPWRSDEDLNQVQNSVPFLDENGYNAFEPD